MRSLTLAPLLLSLASAPALAGAPAVAGTFHCTGGVADWYTYYDVDGFLRTDRHLVNVTVSQTVTGQVARSVARPTVDNTYWNGYFLGVGQNAWNFGTSGWLNGSQFWFMFPQRFAAGPNTPAELHILIGGGALGSLQIPMTCTLTRIP
jgi:hypothetical protein